MTFTWSTSNNDVSDTIEITLQKLLQVFTTGGGLGNLTGAVDPNGVVTGKQGQIYTQVTGGTSTLWTNMDGATTWT